MHTFSIETNQKQIQGRRPCIQKIKYSQHTKKKQHIKLYVQKYGKKGPKHIPLYNLQKVQILKVPSKNKKMVE